MPSAIALFLALAVAATPVGAGALPEDVLFRCGYDGSPDAVLNGSALAPSEAKETQYEPSDASRALVVSAATRLRYDLGDAFPKDAGALEIRFKPHFPQKADQPARTVLVLKGKTDFQAELSFHPNGLRWILQVKGQKWNSAPLTLWHGAVKEGQWNHVLFVWDRTEGIFSIYHQGRWVQSAPSDNRFGGPAFLEIGGEQDAGISVDEIVLYRRAFTHPQAQFLAQTYGNKEDRFASLIERLAKDDEAVAQRRALIARLNGKVGRVSHNKGTARNEVSYPEGVVGVGINPEDIGKIDLSQFSVLHFPQGPRFQIEPAQYGAIVEFVRNGGGYVGCCQGAYFAEQLKLLNYKCYANNIWGLYKVEVVPHFVTDGRKGVIQMHFGNGPSMVPGEGCQALGRYQLEFPDGVKPAAILTGKLGKGTVVVFGTHPLGESVSYKGTKTHFSGKLLETDVMFVNALLYASGLVDGEGRPVGPGE